MLTDLDYELLSAYIDGALTESERIVFELRLRAKPELSRELDELRATIALLNNLPLRKAPRDFTLDAHYMRRTSFFFTSATFSALSTAAAIVLFALGAYLFTGDKLSQSPLPAAEGQAAQSVFLSTATALTVDKSSAVTATELELMNEIASTNTSEENTPTISGGLAAASDLAQESDTVEPPHVTDQLPLVQADSVQLTERPDDATGYTSAPAGSGVPESQQRTRDATETATNLQFAAPNTGGEVNAAVPAPSPIEQTDANAVPALAATQLPSTATIVPTTTPLPTATLAPTEKPKPTTTPSPRPTQAPTAPSLSVTPPTPSSDLLPISVIVVGLLFLLIAVVTTIVRRRNRA